MNKVTIHDWREGHIGQAAYVTDAYYLGVANKLATMITSFSSNEGLEKERIKEWALSLAYYFEIEEPGSARMDLKSLMGCFIPMKRLLLVMEGSVLRIF